MSPTLPLLVRRVNQPQNTVGSHVLQRKLLKIVLPVFAWSEEL